MIVAPPVDWLERITDFALANRGRQCFQNWPRESIRQYLAFHSQQNTLALVKHRDEIVALGTAMQCDVGEISSNWDWRSTNPKGKILLLLDIISTRRGGLTLLFVEMFKKWPPGSVDHVFALRPKGVVEITSKYIRLTTLKD
jgi:hypothetical protein